jgi:S1-C subfamily serine protease
MRSITILPLLASLLIFSGCATTSSMRSAPDEAGEVRGFDAPGPAVRQATLSALSAAGIGIEDIYDDADGSTIIIGKRGMSAFSSGELVRVRVEPVDADRTIVRVLTKKVVATQVAARGDYSGENFSHIYLTLNRSVASQPGTGGQSGESTTEPESYTSSTGSGFLLSESGIVITNFHVVEGRDEIYVVLPATEFEGAARVVLQDRDNDIAILRLQGFNYSEHFTEPIPYALGQAADVELGQEVFTLGYPLGSLLGRSARLSMGNVNSLFGIQDDPRVFQVSDPLQPGNSGGPLLSLRGDVVGIIVSSLNARYLYENAGIIPQNVNFAIKADYLRSLVAMLPESNGILGRTTSLDSLSVEDQVRLVTPFVATVIAQ